MRLQPVSAFVATFTRPSSAGFQMNERYLDWDKAAQTQLLKLACADKLGMVPPSPSCTMLPTQIMMQSRDAMDYETCLKPHVSVTKNALLGGIKGSDLLCLYKRWYAAFCSCKSCRD